MLTNARGILVLVFCAGATLAFAQTPGGESTETTRLSLAAFGDYYWVARNHKDDIEGRQGFWFRRIYLTVDQNLGRTLTGRLRFELNQPGDFRSNLTLEPFVKDAWLRWRASDRLEAVIGMSPTPTFDSIEQFWGYRAIEKTPLDLQRMSNSRDLGISLMGTLRPDRRVRYHFMVGNGSGTGTETNMGKQVALLIGFNPAPALFVEFYADRDDRSGETDRTTVQAFAGWRRADNRVGLQYARQNREVSGGTDIQLDIASVFGVYALRPNVTAVLRIDRMFDPNPEGDRIPYLPFDSTAPSTLIIAGVDLKLHKRLGVIPNVEWVTYDNGVATGPDDDVIPRITFYYSF